MDEYNDEDPPCVDTFQEASLDGEFFVDIGLGLDDITSSDGFDEIIDPNDITMLIKHRNGESVENEPRVEQDCQSDTESVHDITEEEYRDPDDF